MIEELKFATKSAQFFIENLLKTGDIAIDATCGNGHDTLFLANQVGKDGKVFAIDIQPEAIKEMGNVIQENDLDNVTLIENDHANLKEIIPSKYHGNIQTIMFNLGYLPNSDHSIKTLSDSTLKAVKASLDLLAEPGIITICTYPHMEGQKEAENLKKELSKLSGNINVMEVVRLNRNNPPYLIIITKG